MSEIGRRLCGAPGSWDIGTKSILLYESIGLHSYVRKESLVGIVTGEGSSMPFLSLLSRILTTVARKRGECIEMTIFMVM